MFYAKLAFKIFVKINRPLPFYCQMILLTALNTLMLMVANDPALG